MKKGFFERRTSSGDTLNPEKIYEDTGTEKNYGELTWSDKQILCDTLQNSLDAETRIFISRIESEHVVGDTKNLSQAMEDPDWKNDYMSMLNSLYVLSYRAGDLDEKEKTKLIERIHNEAENLGIELRGVNLEAFTVSRRPTIPELVYAVRDNESGKVMRGLSRDDITSSLYSDKEKFPLFEWSVNDEGSGYDVTKSVLYLPTKTGERFSRGVFGEGLKVNQAAIARVPGVALRIHSQYEEENGQPVAWVRHVKAVDNMVVQRGANIRHSVAPNTGSGTTIRFTEQRTENEELRGVLDPRTTPVESVAAEFGKTTFTYPLGVQESGVAYPGISLKPTLDQYLQGLSIGTSDERLLFSYDFHNVQVIAGRDRKYLNNKVVNQEVVQFWEHVHSPALYREFLKRLLFEESPSNTPERSVFFNTCSRILEGVPTEEDELLFNEFVTSLGLKQNIRNYIAWHGNGLISLIDLEKVNVLKMAMSCSEEEEEMVYGALLKVVPESSLFKKPKLAIEDVQREINQEKERELTEKEVAFTEDFSRMFRGILEEFADVTRVFEQNRGVRKIDPHIRYEILSWQVNLSFNVVVKDGVRIITCYLPGNWSDPKKILELSNPETSTKVKAEVSLLYLAAKMLGQGGFNSNQRSYKEYAQTSAQELLDSNRLNTRRSAPPLHDLYHKAEVLMEEQLKGIRSQQERVALENKVTQYTEEVSQLSCTAERLLEIARWCTLEAFEADGSQRLLHKILRRCIVKDGRAQFIIYDDNEIKNQPLLRTVELSSENRVGEWSGYPVFKISDDKYIVSVPTHNNATLSRRSGTSGRFTYAVSDDTVVRINTNNESVVNGIGNDSYLLVDSGCIIVCDMEVSRCLNEYEFSPVPQERAKQDMSIQTGLMKSPITLEYISTHWSDPERIFQDLGQNHMDAGGLQERFLILKDGERIWVYKNNLGDSQILGYELTDNGLGYSPTGISNMGHTRKRNPFLTGKNGEGLKLAAASAKKNGFDIKFSSFGESNDGKRVAWEAEVLVLEEPYTHSGKTMYAGRLGFNVTTQPEETLAGRSSVTSLELPPNATLESVRKWDEWATCIDPRKKDTHGNGGIERILFTKEISGEHTETVGPVTTLYNRPGAIFENGMLVRTDSQDKRTFTLGWNFPSITSTRERTHINLDMARSYIQYFFQHTTDERAIRHLLKSMQEHQVEEYQILWSDASFSNIVEMADGDQKEQDVDASWVLPDSSDYPSLNLFRKIAKELYPNKVLFSYQYAKRRGIRMGGSMRHIREDDRINVSAKDYVALRSIFPTMETYMEEIQSSRIEIDSESLSPLRKMVGAEIDLVSDRIDRIGRDYKNAPLLRYILQKSGVTMKELKSRLASLHPKSSKGTKNDVFIMADDSDADGLASDGIGLRISLLRSSYDEDLGRLYGVLDHELAHKMLGANDYSDEFILMLLLLAKDGIKQESSRKVLRSRNQQKGY